MKRSRRAFLRAAALTGAVGAAGCSQGEDTPTSSNPGGGGGGGGGGGAQTETATGTESPGEESPTDEPTDTPTERPVGTDERWTTFQADLANTGAADLYHGRFTGGEQNWQVQLSEARPTQPVFDEERLYVSTSGALYALDRETTTRRWRVGFGGDYPATPAVDDRGFVYVVSKTGAAKYDGEEGWSAWEFDFVGEFPELTAIPAKSAPLLVDDTVVFNLVVNKRGSPPRASRVVALDAQSGDLRWTWETNREATEPATPYAPTPAVAANSLYVTVGRDKRDATLHALDVNNGNQQWYTDYKGKGWASPAVKDGIVYFADRYIQLYRTDGTQIARRTVDPPPNAYAVATGADHVFMASRVYEGNEGSLFAVNDRGRVEWTFQGEGNLYVPAATDETIYVASGSGSLFALTQSDGLVRWKYDLGIDGVALASGPAVSTDEIYVAAASGSDPIQVFSIAPV